MRWGKVNLLKNKILRKHLDKCMRVDVKLREKMQKLADLSEKYKKKA